MGQQVVLRMGFSQGRRQKGIICLQKQKKKKPKAFWDKQKFTNNKIDSIRIIIYLLNSHLDFCFCFDFVLFVLFVFVGKVVLAQMDVIYVSESVRSTPIDYVFGLNDDGRSSIRFVRVN